ncbi:dTDP-4-dehydrorhamnose 3,5-epimerase [Candidatus Beckwithbacteria bacterium]|nr:dTDP-4-dehydrorhamnose 3,5-epimerase [Candidatus Beckwithbacteria bacterium]
MQISQINQDWLKSQTFTIQKEVTIDGVYVKELNTIVDGRGSITELWSLPWTEKEPIVAPKHVYQSATDYGVVKCWHLHEKHIDQFTVTRGKLQVSLIDLREDSPTFLHANKIIISTQHPKFIKIPFGIMHGWKALTPPEVIVTNFQSEPYDPSDEYKFTWNSVLEEIWEPLNG